MACGYSTHRYRHTLSTALVLKRTKLVRGGHTVNVQEEEEDSAAAAASVERQVLV